MTKQIRVLFIEDQDDDAQLLVVELKKGNYNPLWKRVDTLEAVVSALKNDVWDLILCDYKLPGFNGSKALSTYSEANLDIPFIFVTGTMGEDVAVEAMKMGAHDWVLKDSLARLIPAIDRELKEAENRLMQRIAVESLRNLSRAVNQSPVSIVITDSDGDIEFINPKFTELTGYTLSEVAGQNPRILQSGLTPAKTYSDLWSNITSGKEWSGEFCNKKKNGELYWETASISAVYNSEGVLTHYVAVKEDITEKKRAEENLIVLNQRYNLALKAGSFGVWDRDVQKNELIWDDTMFELFGIFKTEFAGTFEALLKCIHPEDIERFKMEIQQALNDRKDYNTEFRIILPNGSIKYIKTFGYIFRDESGKPIRLTGINFDISESKLAEKALRESEERYRMLFERSNDAIFFVEISTGNYLDANRAAEIMTGRSLNELKKLKTHDITPKGAKNRIERLLNVNDSLVMGEVEYVRPDGSIRTALLNTISLSKDYIIGIAHDVTERNLVEEALRKSEEIFNSFMEYSPIYIFFKDHEARPLRLSKNYEQMLGMPINNILGNTMDELFPSELAKSMIEDDLGVIKNNTPKKVIEVLKGRIYETTKFPIVTPGKSALLAGFTIDITENKKAEENLKNSREQLKKFAAHLQSVREEERISLAREIHDELGQILTAIKIDIGLMKQKVSRGLELITADEILNQIDHLFGMVDKTIKTTRKIMTELRPEVLDTLGFIEAVKSQAKEFQERHQIVCQVQSTISKLDLNSQQSVALFRIFQEALTNVARHSMATKVKIHLRINANKFIMEIIDNGIGLEEDHKIKTDSYGLIGMRERVFLLEGELLISGKKGEGTSIRIEIPYLKLLLSGKTYKCSF